MILIRSTRFNSKLKYERNELFFFPFLTVDIDKVILSSSKETRLSSTKVNFMSVERSLSTCLILFYIIKRNYVFKRPAREYVDIIHQGYKDCDLDNEYLKRRLAHYSIEL